MNNKAEMTLLMIIELVVVITVAVLIFTAATAYAKSTTVIKTNAADDFGMMVNTLVNFPDDIVVQYPINLTRYRILTDKDKVIVMEENDPILKRGQRKFYLPKGYVVNGNVKNKKFVCLEKKSKEIIFRECKKEESFENE